MPSFDVVSEVDHHEIANTLDQANREVATRFDFKGTDSKFELADNQITIRTESEFQLQQMLDILYAKLAKRGIDLACAEVREAEVIAKTATQAVTIRQGIEADLARTFVRQIRQSKLKVQASIQGDQVPVTTKKRDDLQAVMTLLREAELGQPLQFRNMRD